MYYNTDRCQAIIGRTVARVGREEIFSYIVLVAVIEG